MNRRLFLNVLASIPIVGIAENKLQRLDRAISKVRVYSTQKQRPYNLYISPEALEDIRNWGVDQVDEITRREIYCCDYTHRIFTK